jgi:hypothetical protein
LQAFDIRSQQHKRGVLTTQKITKHVSIVGIARGLFENTKVKGMENSGFDGLIRYYFKKL